MANVRIPSLPLTVLIDGTEYIEIAQSDGVGGYVSRRVALSTINGIPSGYLAGPFVVASDYPLYPNSRLLEGTAGNISVTDGGAGADITLDLIATAVTAGTYGGSNKYTQITVDQFGRITAASEGADGGVGTVTQVSVVSANGFAGTVATDTTTPAITLSTTITGILVGNGTSMAGTVPGTGVLAWIATPSSANLAAAMTDETGTGSLVFATSGLWTPSLLFGGNAVGMTYASTPAGRWTQIGRTVFATGSLTLTAKGSSTGAATIAGLPFASANDGIPQSAPIGLASGMSSMSGAVTAILDANANQLSLYQSSNGGGGGLSHSNFSNSAALTFSVVYDV